MSQPAHPTTTRPIVSVIVPTYNHRDYVRQTLDSIAAQTLRAVEVIVVNDGSPDDTADILRPYRDAGAIRYFEQPNAGVASARNRGLREATGEFVALLDDDDLLPPDKLAWQVETLRADPSLAAVGGELWRDPLPLPAVTAQDGTPAPIDLADLFLSCPFTSPGQCLFRRAAIDAVGGLDPALWGVDDHDLYLKLAIAGHAILRVPRVALYYRLHGSNASRQWQRMFDNHTRCLSLRLADVADRPAYARFRRDAFRGAYNYRGSGIVQSGLPMRGVLAWASRGAMRDPWLAAKVGRDLAVRASKKLRPD